MASEKSGMGSKSLKRWVVAVSRNHPSLCALVHALWSWCWVVPVVFICSYQNAAASSPLNPQETTTLLEATIEEVHRAFQEKRLTATQLVDFYLKRIEAYNQTCVQGTVDPATGFQLGDIQPVAS